MPAHAVRYIKKLAIDPDAYVYAVAMPSFVCGIACEKLSQILKKKRIKLSYGNAVYSVANYAIVYPPFPPAGLRVPKTEKKLRKIAEEISEHKLRDHPRANRFIKRRREKVMVPYLELQNRALLDASSSKPPLVRIMGLPKKRKLYRNPFISAADLAKNKEYIP